MLVTKVKSMDINHLVFTREFFFKIDQLHLHDIPQTSSENCLIRNTYQARPSNHDTLKTLKIGSPFSWRNKSAY